MGKTLFQKIWDAHTVGILPDGRTQMFIATHLLHEVTSPQAFGMVRDLGLTVRHPERTFATVDHIIPTDNQAEPFADATADAMIRELRRNCAFPLKKRASCCAKHTITASAFSTSLPGSRASCIW